MQSIKVLFVSPSFYPATYYGGPTFVNKALCDALATNQDVDLRVLTTDANGPHGRVTDEDQTLEYRTIYCRRFMQPDIAPGLLLRLFGMIRSADVVHLNAVYSFTTIPTLALCKVLRRPVIWSLHGALQRWTEEQRPIAKRAWERICDSFCDRARVTIHAASEQEQSKSDEIMRRADSIVIRYGVEIPPRNDDKAPPAGALRLLYLGRLHPIKGIESLLKAVARTQTKTTLDVYGAGDAAYEAQLRSLVDELRLNERAHFHGRVDGQAKEKAFHEADLCVVPSFKESFGSVIGESLARGVPVIASRGTPWERIEQVSCGLWVGNDPQELATAIDRAAAMPLSEMGERGRAWMERDFAWQSVAGEMINQYRMLLRRELREETESAACPKAV